MNNKTTLFSRISFISRYYFFKKLPGNFFLYPLLVTLILLIITFGEVLKFDEQKNTTEDGKYNIGLLATMGVGVLSSFGAGYFFVRFIEVSTKNHD